MRPWYERKKGISWSTYQSELIISSTKKEPSYEKTDVRKNRIVLDGARRSECSGVNDVEQGGLV